MRRVVGLWSGEERRAARVCGIREDDDAGVAF
jgi:hypothetical protein